MKTIYKSRLFSYIIFGMIIITFSYPLGATATTPITSDHKKVLKQFIQDIRIAENRTFQLAQLVIDSPPKDLNNFNRNLNQINNDLDSLRKEMTDYLNTVPTISVENRDILLLLTAVNYTKSALFDLASLAQVNNTAERTILLEEFFKTRSAAINTLNAAETLLSQY